MRSAVLAAVVLALVVVALGLIATGKPVSAKGAAAPAQERASIRVRGPGGEEPVLCSAAGDSGPVLTGCPDDADHAPTPIGFGDLRRLEATSRPAIP